MAEELKPCPCCGGEAAFVELEDGGIVAVCASKDASGAVLHATHVETTRDRLLPRPGTPDPSPQAMWWFREKSWSAPLIAGHAAPCRRRRALKRHGKNSAPC